MDLNKITYEMKELRKGFIGDIQFVLAIFNVGVYLLFGIITPALFQSSWFFRLALILVIYDLILYVVVFIFGAYKSTRRKNPFKRKR